MQVSIGSSARERPLRLQLLDEGGPVGHHAPGLREARVVAGQGLLVEDHEDGEASLLSREYLSAEQDEDHDDREEPGAVQRVVVDVLGVPPGLRQAGLPRSTATSRPPPAGC